MSDQSRNIKGSDRTNIKHALTESAPAYTGRKSPSNNEKAVTRPTPASTDKTKR